MTNYIPTTNEVRHAFGEAFTGDGSIVSQDDVVAENRAEFDRWLAAHDRQVAENAWDEGAVHGAHNCLFARDSDPCPHNPYRRD